MRLTRICLDGYRSVEGLDFEAGPLTVLFGKNNAGKTNVLETIYGVFNRDRTHIRRTHAERYSSPQGALFAQLEAGRQFDEAVADAIHLDLTAPPVDREVTFSLDGVVPAPPAVPRASYDEDHDDFSPPRQRIESRVRSPQLDVLLLNWDVASIHERVEQAIGGPWLEMHRLDDGSFSYEVPAARKRRVEQLASLASDLLPDFVDGSIRAHVTAAQLWDEMPRVLVEYYQRGLTQCADLVDAAGHGAARWMAAAIEIALHLMRRDSDLWTLRERRDAAFSGHVLLVDEPEAHLHPAAVSSMVRWCQRMVRHGFTIMVASHHEEFLRIAGPDVTLVHVTRDPDLVRTEARTLPSATTKRLQELASDIGMHPAAALSLHRGILFVEGPLDEAVLDEYAGMKFDAAGVKVVPIHGTKNLEGLVAVEIVKDLGIKVGILTDATEPSSMADRSGNKRSSEEKKVLRVLAIAEAEGLPIPTAFGVPEADLLFALPEDAVRSTYLLGQFPGWTALVKECRDAEGKRPSDSVNWKQFAREKYGLPIDTSEGVRDVVRTLDLAGISLPSIDGVVDQIVEWATR